MSLKESLDTLTKEFVAGIMEVVRGASLVELTNDGVREVRPREVGPTATRVKSGRLPRRSMEEIDRTVGKIAALLKGAKGGLRSEQIRNALKLDSRELPRVIKRGIETKAIAILSGHKRSTTYGLGREKLAKAKKSATKKPAKK
jgi:hypothetical protein